MIVTIAEVLDKVIVPQDVLIRTSVLMVVGCAVAFCLSRWRIRSLILLIVAIGALGLIDQVVLNHFNDADIYQAIISEYGNDARIIRALSKIGAEMGEDTSASAGTTTNGGGDSVETLMASEAYNNPKHADHQRVSKIVSDHFAKKAADDEKAGRAAVM